MNEDEKRRLLESPCNETEAAKIEALEKKNEALKKEKEALKKEKEALKKEKEAVEKEKEAVEKEKDALEDRMNSVAYRDLAAKIEKSRRPSRLDRFNIFVDEPARKEKWSFRCYPLGLVLTCWIAISAFGHAHNASSWKTKLAFWGGLIAAVGSALTTALQVEKVIAWVPIPVSSAVPLFIVFFAVFCWKSVELIIKVVKKGRPIAHNSV